VAKLKVNNKGEDLKTVYGIDKNHIDGYYVHCIVGNAIFK